DEIPASERLSRMLRDCGVQVLGVARNNFEALSWFAHNTRPDVVFADIRLGSELSFESLKKISVHSPVIFITAYEHFAINAFSHGGVDYLLKPVTPEKLGAAIDNLKYKIKLFSPVAEPDFRKSFLVAAGANLRQVPVSEISCFISEFNTTQLCVGNRQFPLG